MDGTKRQGDDNVRRRRKADYRARST
jgi:hypothetical protein